MFKRICLLATVLSILYFSSCTQESVLSIPDEERYSVDTVEDGSVLEQGATILISFDEMGSRSNLVRIVMNDAEGVEIASTDVDPSLLKGSGVPLTLPDDLENGAYTLSFTVFEGNDVLHEESRYLYVVSGVFEVNSLETYPPGVGPGDSLSARITLTSPSVSDPWIRWSLEGIVLKEGFLSDTGLLCNFEVPAVEGIYSLKVELFPVEPDDDQVSSVYRQSDLFVDSDDQRGWDNAGDRIYRYFIDFSDALINKMAPESVPEIIGSPATYIEGQMEGISFSEEDGLVFDRYALELLSGGRAREFTLSIAFSFDNLPEKGIYNVFSTGTDDSSFSLVYEAGSTGEFVCEFRSYSRTFRSQLPSNRLEPGEPLYLDIQYKGSMGVATLDWMSQGELLVRDEGLPVASMEEGSTVIGAGGENPGFPMVWYTLGVFTEEENDPSVIAEGDTSPEELLYEDNGSAPEKISIDDINLFRGLTTLEVQSHSASDGVWQLKMMDAENRELYTARFETASSEGTESLVLSFIYDDRGLFISSSLDAAVMGPYEYNGPVSLDIVSESSDGLESIQAVRLFRD